MAGTSSQQTSAKPRTATPLYATPRDYSRRTEGAQVAVVAKHLGTPLIPWQQQVADVAGERLEDGSYAYEVVVVSVPRQTGKTTLLRALGTYRCLVCRRDVFYTAQTGKDARERWMDLVKTVRINEALKTRVTVGLRGGSEQVVFPGGAAFRVFAPTVESLHGYTPPTVMLDEAFALSGMAGELLFGAIGPAQMTIVDRQIWIVSTAGTAESTFLHDWIDRGIEGAPRVACFVWGASDDQDPFDVDDIAAFHPGVGHVLNGKRITAADVLGEASKNSRAEYERAYANRRTMTLSHLIPSEVWRALGPGDVPLRPPGIGQGAGLVLGFDVAADRQSSAIVGAWDDEHGRRCVKVLRAGQGMGWLAPAIRVVRAQLKPAAVVAVGSGPALDVIKSLEGLDRFHVLNEREFATACGWMLDAIDEQTITHDDGDLLMRSAVGLVTRPAVTDGVAFSRRHSVGDSSPAIAATAAGWFVGHKPAPDKPFVYVKGDDDDDV